MGCPVRPGGDDGEEHDAESGRGAAGFNRRSFLKSALLIGGTGALDTSLDLFGLAEPAAAAVQSEETPSVSERTNRQHAWDAYEYFDPEKETSIPPARHLFLLSNYRGNGRPTETDRRQVGMAFDGLESEFGWSSDGVMFTVAYSPSYFDRYDEDLPLGIDPDSGFDKPGLLRPDQLIDSPGVTLDHEDPVPETYDVLIHLASDHEELLLAAENALWGETVDIDGGISLGSDLDGIFSRPAEYPERRVGFAGADNLKEEGDAGEDGGVYPEEVPVDRDGTDAKLSMGFNDLFRNSIPRETNATMVEEQQLVEPKPPGAFAQGSIQHLSKLDMKHLPEGGDPGFEDDPTGTGGGWYQYDAQQRAERMFSPHHDINDMGVVGEDLGNSNAPVEGDTPMRDLDRPDGPDIAEGTQTDAEEEEVVGHVQKCARARFDLNQRLTDDADDDLRTAPSENEAGEEYDTLRGHDGAQEAEQVVLRRDVDTTDAGRPGNHFMALMRFNPYMVYMRQAMNGVAFDTGNFGLTDEDEGSFQHDDLRDDVEPGANGIVNFLETKRRGNFVVPPLRLRALPPAQAARPPMTVGTDGAAGPDLDGADGTVEVVVGAGNDAPDEAAMEAAADAWRDGEPVETVQAVAADFRAGGQLLPDGYERDPREEQPEEYGGPTDIAPASMGTIRFGPRREVNAGGGAEPTHRQKEDVDGDGEDELVLEFDVADLSSTEDAEFARLYAETSGGFPVFATAPVRALDAERRLRREVALDG